MKRPYGWLDQSVRLETLMREEGHLSQQEVQERVKRALENDAVDALSLLLTKPFDGKPFSEHPWLEDNATELIDIAEEHEAVTTAAHELEAGALVGR